MARGLHDRLYYLGTGEWVKRKTEASIDDRYLYTLFLINCYLWSTLSLHHLFLPGIFSQFLQSPKRSNLHTRAGEYPHEKGASPQFAFAMNDVVMSKWLAFPPLQVPPEFKRSRLNLWSIASHSRFRNDWRGAPQEDRAARWDCWSTEYIHWFLALGFHFGDSTQAQ